VISRSRPDAGPLLHAELGPELGAVTCDPGQLVELRDQAVVAALVGEHRSRGQRIELAGRRLERRGPAGRVRAGLAVVRGSEVAPDVSVLDHLIAAAGRRGRDLLAASPWLAERGQDPAGVLSGGERRLLGWLVARAVGPQVVLLDRAGTGLDAAAFAWAHGVVDAWLAEGIGVLVLRDRAEEARWVTHTVDGRPRSPRGPV
jgi:ABC-type branched-subunit amino acid transport system ATPase component